MVQQTNDGKILDKLPFGPSTTTFWPSSFIFTFSGITIGFLPIRDIFYLKVTKYNIKVHHQFLLYELADLSLNHGMSKQWQFQNHLKF